MSTVHDVRSSATPCQPADRPARPAVRRRAHRGRAGRRAAARPRPGRRPRCSPPRPSLFAIGAGRGVQHTPYAWLFRAFVRPRLGPPAELEDAAPPRFAQARRPRLRRSSALVGFLAGATVARARSPTGFALVAALLNAVFGFCLGCEIYLLGQRALADPRPRRQPPDHVTPDKEQHHEPRDHARHRPVGRGQPRRPRHRPRRGRRGHHRLRQGPHPGRHQARLDDRPAGPGPPRLRQQGAVRGAAAPSAASPTTTPSCSTAATTTGSPPTPTGTSSSTATTTSSCSTAAARSGSSTPAS